MNIKSKFNTNGYAVIPNFFNNDQITKLAHNVQEHILSNLTEYTVGNYRRKSNLLLPWVYELAESQSLVDLATDMLPNATSINVLDAMFWIKLPNSTSWVSAHQDGRYWNINFSETVDSFLNDAFAVWIPITTTPITGAGGIRYFKGSHLKGLVPHIDVTSPNNLLKRGQTAQFNEAEFITELVEPAPGLITIHHPFTIHDSSINATDKIRVALHIQYISNNVTQKTKVYGTEVVQQVIPTTNIPTFKIVDPIINTIENNISNWQAALTIQENNYFSII